MDITVFIKNGCCGLQFCLPIAVKNNERRCITSKSDAVALQKCLPIAVKEINKDQLIFLYIKRCGGSSKMPFDCCEKYQQ